MFDVVKEAHIKTQMYAWHESPINQKKTRGKNAVFYSYHYHCHSPHRFHHLRCSTIKFFSLTIYINSLVCWISKTCLVDGLAAKV